MNDSMIKGFIRLTALWALAWTATHANADVVYGGQTAGFPGDNVELTINAEAGTTIESIDIVPTLSGNVASVLSLVSLTETTALTDGGFGSCTGLQCAIFYVAGKTFASDTLLATLRFGINPAAVPGTVTFSPGVTVGETILPVTSFEVLAVPEPSTWAMFSLGLLAVGYAVRRRRAATTGV